MGRLSEKAEAAGKIRIFAITNSFIQMICSPIHYRLFDLLESIPQDGTHNQLKPFELLMDKIRCYGQDEQVFSLDLSAATDRLPLSLQKVVIGQLFGNHLSEL